MRTLIIGSGAGGGIAAMVRALAGDEVVVLEKGPNWSALDFSDDEIKFGSRAMINLDHRIEPRTWSEGPFGGAFEGRVLPASRCVGGGTVHYAAMSFRLRADDFAPLEAYGPVPGGNVADWPFEYSDLEKYYTRVEYLIGVQGLDPGATATYPARPGGLAAPLEMPGNAAQSARSRPYPMPPGAGKIDCLLFAKAALDMGLHPYPCPLAINGTAYRSTVLDANLEPLPAFYDSVNRQSVMRLRQACEQCGMCSGYGCPVDAKNSTLVTALEVAAQTGRLDLRSGCTVSRIVASADGSRATGVEYLRYVRGASGDIALEGPTFLPADRVIVAADAIETPRLFLLSGLDRLDRSGQLGQNLMTHHLPSATGFFPDLVNNHRGVYTTHVMDDLYVIPAELVPRPVRDSLPAELRNRALKGGVVACAGPSAGEPVGVGGLVSLALTLPWGESHVPALQGAFGRQIFLGMVGDDVPQRQNRVTLDPNVKDVYGLPVARVAQLPHPRDLAVLATAAPIMQQILEKAGAVVSAVATATPPLYPSQYNHRMGTMRMGEDPATSVVDENGRFHAMRNLYVMDGSVMVSAGGYNPTETIQAVSWMLSERLP